MAIKKRALTIILEPEVWDEAIVRVLVGMGHTVKAMQAHGYDLIVGPRCWRVPKGKAGLEDLKVVITQASKLIHVAEAPIAAHLNLPMEDEYVVEDQEVSQQEADGTIVERVVSAYRPATRPGKKKQRTKVTRGGYAASDQGCDAGC